MVSSSEGGPCTWRRACRSLDAAFGAVAVALRDLVIADACMTHVDGQQDLDHHMTVFLPLFAGSTASSQR